MKLKSIPVFGGAVVLFLIFFIVFHFKSKGIEVAVVNVSENPISNVYLVYGGEVLNYPDIDSGNMHRRKISPMGGKALALKFKDFKGAQHSKDIDVYLEKGFSGKIEAIVDGSDEVTFRTDVKL